MSKKSAGKKRLLTIPEVLTRLGERAGVKGGEVPIRFLEGSNKPPTLVREKHYVRRVEVGTEWMRLKQPRLFAVFVAARLSGQPIDWNRKG